MKVFDWFWLWLWLIAICGTPLVDGSMDQDKPARAPETRDNYDRTSRIHKPHLKELL